MKQKKFLRILVTFLVLTIAACGDGSKGDINYVALGASDVTGVGATPVTNGYVFLIEENAEQQSGEKVDLDNLGIPGAKIGDIDNLEVQLLKLDKPDLITITTGGNDIIDGDAVDGFESDLNGLFGKLRSISPDAIIVIGNLPDLTQVERFQSNPDADVTPVRIAGYNAAISRQAAVHGAKLVDLFSVPLSDAYTSEADGFHPNDKGHQVIAQEFNKVINVLIPELVAAAN